MIRPFRQWLGKLLHRSAKQLMGGRRRVRPGVETLEDRTLPSLTLLSINCTTPSAAITNATAVTYMATFNEAATGVNPTDFQLVTTGTVGTMLTQVTPVSASVYTITVSGISGSGTLGLNLANNGSIHDSGGGSLSNSSFTGQVYTINQVWPFVESINRASPAGPVTNANSVSFTVTFSEAVTGVAANDFQLVLGGTATGTVSQVTPVSGSIYTVTVTGITGNGTLGLNLVDNGSIRDLAGNPLSQQNAPAAFLPPQAIAVGYSPSAVVSGDVNGDGKTDLIVADYASDAVSVLLGNGNGTFQTQQTFFAGYEPPAVALGDVNGDSNPDVIVANGQSNTVSVLLGNGNGTFRPPRTLALISDPVAVAVGDVNGDGKTDVVVANKFGDTVSVLLGNGDGTFQAAKTFATGFDPVSVALADVNGDGKADLLVANELSDTVSVLLGNGNGTFQTQKTFTTGPYPLSLALGDVNGDSIPDLVTANSEGNTVSVLLGNGNGTFQGQQTFATGSDPVSVAIADANGDGNPDLLVADEGANAVSVLLGNGNGTFQKQQSFAAGYTPNAVAVGDVSSDGRLDIVAANESTGYGSVSVLLNSITGSFTGQVYDITSGSTTGLAFSGFPSSATVGTTLPFTLTALNSSNQADTGYTGTVHFSSTDTGASSILPANYHIRAR